MILVILGSVTEQKVLTVVTIIERFSRRYFLYG